MVEAGEVPFDADLDERDLFDTYSREQRANWARNNRIFALIATATVLVFSAALTAFLSPRAALIANVSCASAAVLMGAYALFTRSSRFPEARWSELLMFVAMLPPVFGIIFGLSLDADVIGWPPHTILFDNIVMVISFSTLAFVANFRGFLAFFAVLLPAYVAWLVGSGTELAPLTFNLISTAMLAGLAIFSNRTLSRQSFAIFKLQRSLEIEKRKTEDLLYSILPEDVAARLKSGEAVADPFSQAIVVFVDIVGSSALARRIAPVEFIATLNAIFQIADRHARLNEVEKVKTIGDAYLVVAGARGGGDAVGAMRFALGVITDVRRLAAEKTMDLDLRIGIHSGPVIGGVIGRERAIYDYWGDTMNVAARLEGVARPGGVAVSRPVFDATSHAFDYDPPRWVTLKGIGRFELYDCTPIRL